MPMYTLGERGREGRRGEGQKEGKGGEGRGETRGGEERRLGRCMTMLPTIISHSSSFSVLFRNMVLIMRFTVMHENQRTTVQSAGGIARGCGGGGLAV